MASASINIIQISDLHLMADPAGALLGVTTQDSCQAVIDLIKQEEKPDFILLSGDLSQDGSKEAYRRLAEMLGSFQVPVYCIPGNHDDINNMRAVYPLTPIVLDKQIMAGDWQIILLNSQKAGAVEGYLAASELDFMEHCLQSYPTLHAMVVFHHHPYPVGAAWLDNLGVKNADEFWQRVSSYPMVKAVLCGHVHQESMRVMHGIPAYSPPSTCIQFKRHQDHFGLEHLPPGYRWVQLHADGRIETAVKRVNAYVGVFDESAKGY